MMNNSGRVVTIFVVITGILLISMTAISIFFFQQEYQKRKGFENALGESKGEIVRLQTELDDAKKQKFLFEEKNKELDERVNSLLDELELEQGLKEEMKKEQAALSERVDKEIKLKEKQKEELNKKIEEAEARIKELEEKLKTEVDLSLKLKERNRLLEGENVELADGLGLKGYEPPAGDEGEGEKKTAPQELEEIVVKTVEEAELRNIPSKLPDGRVISIDDETEFVIIDLGKKHGLTLGRMMSLYRGDKYLGDIKVTRVQPEMSAADLILPLTGKVVRKNDQVVAK